MKRLVAVAVAVFAVIAGSAGQAVALDVPSPISDCKTAPVAAMPGGGVAGFFDPKPNPTPPAGDPFVTNPTTSIYEQSGYAGLQWHTYDVGLQGVCIDTEAKVDTMVGNAIFSAAVWGVAAANGLHNRIAHPDGYMGPVDRIVEKVSGGLGDIFWSWHGAVPPPGVIALLLVAARLFVRSMDGDYSGVARGFAWTFLVMVIMTGLHQYPARAAGMFDDAIIAATGTVNTGAAGVSGVQVTGDPAMAQGAQLHDKLLYPGWLRGMFADPDSAAATRWGPLLFKASTNSWATAQTMKDPAVDKAVTEGKAAQWDKVMADMKTQDPRSYTYATGQHGGRIGASIMTLLSVMFTTWFRIIADLFVFAGLIMLRLVVMFFPAIAVLGILSPGSEAIHRIRNIVGASVLNVVVFSVGATIHTAVIGGLINQSGSGSMNVMVIILCAVTTIAAFLLLRKHLSLTNVVGLTTGGTLDSLKRTGKTTRKIIEPDIDKALAGATAGAAAGGPWGAAAGAGVAVAADTAADTDSRGRPPRTPPDTPPADTGTVPVRRRSTSTDTTTPRYDPAKTRDDKETVA